MLDARLVNHCLHAMAGRYPHVDENEVEAIFIWGRADREWQATDILDLAAELYFKCNQRPAIAIPGYVGMERGQGRHGYPGPGMWKEILFDLEVPRQNVATTSGDGINTKTEMEDLLNLAIERNWKTVYGVTLQSHALRAMLGTVQSLKTRGLLKQIRVFPVWPHEFDPAEKIYGSQGEGPYRILDWFDQEFDRIERYMAKGDLCTLEELRDYLHFLLS